MKLIKKKKKSGKTWQKVFVILVAAFFILSMFPVFLSRSHTNLDKFAQCVTSAGGVMYGAYDCSACNYQKQMFGNSFDYVNYIDCSKNEELCTEKNITTIPTWIINNKSYVGVLSIEDLSRISNCSLS